jgi:deoxyinosine 3'endonuclease (endonuclease V)
VAQCSAVLSEALSFVSGSGNAHPRSFGLGNYLLSLIGVSRYVSLKRVITVADVRGDEKV